MGLEEMIKRYIITAAEYGGTPNHKQLDAYENYAKRNDADILIIPVHGQQPDDAPLHDRFNDYIVANKYNFSKFLHIKDFQIKAQNINPLTGLKRFGAVDKSLIIGSPKQHLEHVANSNINAPKAVISTGACTLPNYKKHLRIGCIAYEDHLQGGLALEVDSDNGEFFVRQLRNARDGSFIDLGVEYKAKGAPKKVRADTMVLGDMHECQISEESYEAACEQINTLKPKYVMLHDVFDGYSISHHDLGKNLLKASKSKQGKLSLHKELYDLGARLHELSAQGASDTKYYVVKSNHDEVLWKYLDECRFIGDPEDLQLSVRLANVMLDNKDPLLEGIRLTYGELPKNIKFLERDSDFKRLGWHLSSHGDKGPSGSRGSMASFDYSLGKAIVGHNHSAAIRKDVFRVGTMERADVDYVKGTTGNWTDTNAVIYSNKQAQLITSIHGRWMI